MTLRTNERKIMMTFEDKLQQCIRNLERIDKPDHSRYHVYYFADFIELLALISGIDGISYGDVLDRFFGEPKEETNSEGHDKNESFLDGLFLLIEERINLYKEVYPFKKEDDVISLKSDLSSDHKLYLFLLLSSSLTIFRSFNAELTTDFETICYEAMKAYLPNAIVKEFGKNSEYTGNAREKIMRLAEDIGLTTDDYEIQQIGERNIQERGLDIVGWLPFKDNCSNLMIFLGQCACGKQFESKQHDVRRFKHYYHFYRTEPQYTFFIPYSLINPSERKFYHSDLIEDDYLIFERMRILSLLKGNDSVYNNLNTKLLVEACIKYPTPTFNRNEYRE